MAAALTFDEARRCVLDAVARTRPDLDIETVPLEEAGQRVLAEDLSADRDYPPTRRSVRDGFAVRAAELPGPLRVIGEARAGGRYHGTVGAGEAVEIMTGAPVPTGADAVIMIEHSLREGDDVSFLRTVPVGDAINPQGWECRRGDLVLKAGMRLDYAGIAALAMAGQSEVAVRRKPRVGIVATGDEVVDVSATPSDEQVRNTNAYSLASQVHRAGGIPVMLGIARDNYPDLRARVEWGLGCDLLLISGGVSAGKYDLVERVLHDLGAESFFDRVRIQPGQPLVFGKARDRFWFGLPGNPASTMVTFEVFARAALELIGGQSETSLHLLRARLTQEFTQHTGLTRFLPASLSPDGAEITPLRWRGSGDIGAMARANAFLVSDPDRDRYAAGDSIRVLIK